MRFCFFLSFFFFFKFGFAQKQDTFARLTNPGFEYTAKVTTEWPGRREYSTMFELNGKIYLGGGYQPSDFVLNQGHLAFKSDFWCYDPVTTKWKEIAPIPEGGRQKGLAFVLNGQAYVLGGNGLDKVFNSFIGYNSCYRYNDAANTWTRVADFPIDISDGGCVFTIGNKAYAGFNGSYSSKFYQYDPVANTWTGIADFPGNIRRDATAFSCNGFGFVGMGNLNGNIRRDFWRYDASNNTWTRVADCPVARSEAKGVSTPQKGYFLYTDVDVNKREVYEYDPVANTWLLKTRYPLTANTLAIIGVACSGNGLIYGSMFTSNEFLSYDLAQNKWTFLAPLGGYPRSRPLWGSVGGKAYMGMGNILPTLENTNDIWEYDYTTQKWSFKQNGRFGNFDFTVPIGNSVYFGLPIITDTLPRTTSYSADSMYRWNPSTGTITGVTRFPGGLRTNTLALAVGNNLYIGLGSFTNAQKDFWEYNTITNTWTRKADFPTTPSTLTGLTNVRGFTSPDGKIYAGTGYNSSTSNLYFKEFYQYDPSTNIWTRKADFPILGRYYVSFSIGNYGYIGFTSIPGSGEWYLYEYDMINDKWERRAKFPKPYENTTGTAITHNEKAYYIPQSNLDISLWEYTPLRITEDSIFYTGPAGVCNGNAPDSIKGETAIARISGTIQYKWIRSIDNGNSYQIISGETAKDLKPGALTTTTRYRRIAYDGVVEDTSNTIIIQAYALPATPVISWNGTQLSTAAGATSYQWFLNNNPISGANANIYTPVQNGAYTVRVTNSNSCAATSTSLNVTTTSVNEITIGITTYKLFPNPVDKGILYIQSKESIGAATFIQIFDIKGKKLMSGQLNSGLSRINLSHFSPGTYIVHISDKTKSGSVKITVVK